MIIAVVGPTGIGKTRLSIMLAKKYNAIIINCDAIQVYRELNIGSAKVTEKEKEGIPHYLFDVVSVKDDYTVFDYQKDLRRLLDEYSDKNIIIVGGTGLYLKAGLFDYRFNIYKDKNEYLDYSNDELYSLVLKKDSDTDIHHNNRRRMINFLNRDLETHNKDKILYKTIFLGLNLNREDLYHRCNERVEIMLENGLLEEVRNLYNQGIRSRGIMTAIGYKELYEYFDNNITKEEAIELIKKNTRKYVKRQYTWFNNQMDIKWFDVDLKKFNNTYDEVINYIETLDRQ